MLLSYCLTGEEPAAQQRESGFADARIPERVRPVLVRATQFDPQNRFATAEELKVSAMAALGRVPDGGPVAQPPAANASYAWPLASTGLEVRRLLKARSIRLAISWLEFHVPAAVGVAWNVAVIAPTAFMVFIAFMAIIHMNEVDQQKPFLFIAYQYGVWANSMFLCAGYMLLDRRRLRIRLPFMARRTWLWDFNAISAVQLAQFAAIVLVYMLFVG